MHTSNNPYLPSRIGRLEELAKNLWWSWHPEGRDLFRALDYPLWRVSGHNPVKQLREIGPQKLRAVAADPAFLNLYDGVMAAFDADMRAFDTWFPRNYSNRLKGPIAYFSMEFAIHNSLPIYAGGLGVLAGDICKEASDLGLPLVGVGFMYPQGYFRQHISADGWQEEVYQQLKFDEAPVSRVVFPEASRPLLQVRLDNKLLSFAVWEVRVGHTTIYLLDTNVEQNSPLDRQLSARLYTANREERIQQEILLGIGGVRALRALGIQPAVWHLNEGHTAFMMLERAREEVQKGVPFAKAVAGVKATTVFTTHTPVPAGTDVFPVQLVEKYLHNYWDSLGIERDTFLRLGQHDEFGEQAFNMSVLGLKMADHRNAVSQLHGKVARRMWQGLWPQVPENEVPITHITNGVHAPTWIAAEMDSLYQKYLGREWIKRHEDADLWDRVQDIPDEELWEVRQLLKRKLISAIQQRAQEGWAEGRVTPVQVLAMGALLDPEVLTLGFVRRFAEYKRPTLVRQDIDRLRQIINNRSRPVQIIFAGKSHPADLPSKYLLHQAYILGTDRAFQGRIAFVEDYDIHIAHYLVQGVDVWLNTPRRPQEASGTSGMKAGLNGVVHLSVPDGWWYEGYNGANGWAIGDALERSDPAEQDQADAEALYRLLSQEVVPLYYDRDVSGVPRGWIRLVKEAIRSIAPRFSARRMLMEYTEQMYLTASGAGKGN